MACQILIANKCNMERASIIAVLDGDHKLTKNEGMQEWIESGESAELWHRRTTKVIITDRDSENLQFLMEPLVDYSVENPYVKGSKYECIEPSRDSEIYQELLVKGEVSVTFDVFNNYIVENA